MPHPSLPLHLPASEWLAAWGYPAVAGAVGLESLGVPVPGETMLLVAAAAAAAGRLSIAAVIACAAAGAVAGDACGYWIGRAGGLRLLHRYGRLLHVDDRRLALAQRYYERHGGKTVFFGRFVALLRVAVAMLAGVARMPYGRFTLFNAAGGLTWALVVGTLGYLFGASLPTLEHTIGRTGIVILLLVAAAAGWMLVRHRARAA